MRFLFFKNISILFFCLCYGQLFAYNVAGDSQRPAEDEIIRAAMNVIKRTVGVDVKNIQMELIPAPKGYDTFVIEAHDGHLTIKGNSPVALTHGFYTYLKEGCKIMITWSTTQVPDLTIWPDFREKKVTSPYKYRYFLNVVTYGYTMPYWDWERWEKEIDWMALHGINMPLALVANEAIALRVWQKFGLSKNRTNEFFTGPAYLPWHRMGNLNSWSVPLDESWHKDQIALQHRILNRMRDLDFSPIVPAFAGFVPEEFGEKYPEVALDLLEWGGFPKKNNALVLSPRSPWFKKIGKLFVEEWEKEFGKCTYYLSDTFNEMDVPVPKDDPDKKYEILAQFGKTIYESVTAGNPDAVWVTQGWTFGYMHQFWDKKSLTALLKPIPDDKMIIIDLACEYPDYVWYIDPVWQTHKGFYGKQWIYSFVPNFGGKTALTGVLKFYADNPSKALASPYRKSLKGFGSAPEGTENNEVVYELLADLGWSEQAIDINEWIGKYAISRYGAYPPEMKMAWTELLQSAYNTFGSYPRYIWQTLTPDERRKGKVNDDPKFMDAVLRFLSCSDQLDKSELYRNDAIELAATYLGIKADDFYKVALMADKNGDQHLKKEAFGQAVFILNQVDRLLASHPLHRLSPWVSLARSHGKTSQQKGQYEADALRLITTWGGHQEDYAARFWSGLISSYYIPRMQKYLFGDKSKVNDWEEDWINTAYIEKVMPFADPLSEAKKLVQQFSMPKAQ